MRTEITLSASEVETKFLGIIDAICDAKKHDEIKKYRVYDLRDGGKIIVITTPPHCD